MLFILSTILSWTLRIVGVIARFVSFLFVKLGLWVPAAFALGYLIVCLLLEIPPDNPAGLRVLLIGCIASAIVGIAAVAYLKEKKRMDARRAAAGYSLYRDQKSKYTGSKRAGKPPKGLPPQGQFYDDGYYEEGYYRGGDRTEPEIAGGNDSPQEMRVGYSERENVSAAQERFDERREKKYVLPPEVVSARAREAGLAEPQGGRMVNPSPQREIADPSLRVASETAERPLVFATRKDPNMIIVEYSDRLLFFRKNRNGEPELIATEYKR